MHLDSAEDRLVRPDGTVPLRVEVGDTVVLDDNAEGTPRRDLLTKLLDVADDRQQQAIARQRSQPAFSVAAQPVSGRPPARPRAARPSPLRSAPTPLLGAAARLKVGACQRSGRGRMPESACRGPPACRCLAGTDPRARVKSRRQLLCSQRQLPPGACSHRGTWTGSARDGRGLCGYRVKSRTTAELGPQEPHFSRSELVGQGLGKREHAMYASCEHVRGGVRQGECSLFVQCKGTGSDVTAVSDLTGHVTHPPSGRRAVARRRLTFSVPAFD